MARTQSTAAARSRAQRERLARVYDEARAAATTYMQAADVATQALLDNTALPVQLEQLATDFLAALRTYTRPVAAAPAQHTCDYCGGRLVPEDEEIGWPHCEDCRAV